jgi:MFS family permease
LSVLILAFVTNFLVVWQSFLLLALWRFVGSFSFRLIKTKLIVSSSLKVPSYFSLLRKKEILLYLFPWAMFSVINFIETPILESFFGPNATVLQVLEWVIVGFIAVGGGLIADIVGRKPVVIAGFIMLGLEYALISIVPNSQGVFYFFTILDGIVWGLFSSVFLITLWGELGKHHVKEKYYVLGGLTFFMPGILSELMVPVVGGISTGAAFSVASFFLFIAVLPLIYAPETLPENEIKQRQLRNYIKEAERRKAQASF